LRPEQGEARFALANEMVRWTISRAERAEHERRAGGTSFMSEMLGRSPKLAAFAAFAGPLDLLTCFACRGSPQGAKEPRPINYDL